MAGNIFDYLDWRGDISIKYSEFNVIDALILTSITYINYPDANDKTKTFKEGFAEWSKLPDKDKFRGLAMMKHKTFELAKALANSRRYDDIKLTRYLEVSKPEIEEQFSAMTFLLPDDYIFIAFRGTDNTLVGWKEDFNMAIQDGTPSQLDATKYTTRVAQEYPNAKILLGGHSKGGNLAVWAAVNQPKEIKSRLIRVYNFDAPGFSKKVFDSNNYQLIEDKILSIVPECSIVGIIMSSSPQLVVKSDSEGALQHNPFTWQIQRTDFVYLPERSFVSRHLKKAFDSIVDTLDPDDYSKVVDKIYKDLKETDDIKNTIEGLIQDFKNQK